MRRWLWYVKPRLYHAYNERQFGIHKILKAKQLWHHFIKNNISLRFSPLPSLPSSCYFFPGISLRAGERRKSLYSTHKQPTQMSEFTQSSRTTGYRKRRRRRRRETAKFDEIQRHKKEMLNAAHKKNHLFSFRQQLFVDLRENRLTVSAKTWRLSSANINA